MQTKLKPKWNVHLAITVIPAQAGIQNCQMQVNVLMARTLDTGLRPFDGGVRQMPVNVFFTLALVLMALLSPAKGQICSGDRPIFRQREHQ